MMLNSINNSKVLSTQNNREPVSSCRGSDNVVLGFVVGLLLSGCTMKSQFEVQAEADPKMLIAITNYGTSQINNNGDIGFRIYFRNTSPHPIATINFYVQAYDAKGVIQINHPNKTWLNTLVFNETLPAGKGAHPYWSNVWKNNSTITCGVITSAKITYADNVVIYVPNEVLNRMTYNSKCLNLSGGEFDF
ncbi:hypothetical protein L4D09_20220 [Photobacterium makurazakiensis]|uniref:hypothetical protein n=1 Tax=Photobacterium makurazakiensis TaxID=2910234 RepID=UPI003D0E4E10